MDIQIDLTQENVSKALGVSDERCETLGKVSADFVDTIIGTKDYNTAKVIEATAKECTTLGELLFSVYCLGIMHEHINGVNHAMQTSSLMEQILKN